MGQVQRERIGAATGVVAVIFIVLSGLWLGTPPGFNDSADQVADYVSDNRGALQASAAFTILSGVFFIWFLGSLTQALRRAEGRGPGRLAPVAFAGGILGFAFAGIGTVLQWAPSYHEGLDPFLIQALWDAGNVSYAVMAGVGFTILIGASSVVALTTGALPRPLGWFGGALALLTLVVGTVAAFSETGAFAPSDGALGYIAFVGFLIWLLASSIVLFMRAGAPVAAPQA